MSNAKSLKKEKRNKAIKKLIDITLALIIAGGAVYAIKTVTSDFSDINRTTDFEESTIEQTEPSVPDENAIIYVTEMKDNEDVYSGPLIVVNSSTEYKGKDDNLVSMYNVLQDDGTSDYLVMSAEVKLKKNAASALNKMVKAFASETGKKDIIVDGGFRSVNYQQELYDAAEDKSAAAKPGFSDYHTGYSIDLSIGTDDGTMTDFTGKDDYSWFEKNAHKYGFILRFPEGKKELTGYDYRPWHFRYVGQAHAYYMYKNNLCLEEYVEKLKTFEYTQTHLVFSDDNGNEYETYYYPMDASGSTSILAVPDTEYQISGNNTDGFIVIFKSNPDPEPTEAASGQQETQAEKSGEAEKTKAEETKASEPAETKKSAEKTE